MNAKPYSEPVEIARLSPATPPVIWGALMVVAVLGAVATVWQSSGATGDERLIAEAPADAALKRDVARLAAERNELASRLASIERGLGELKFASRAQPAPETTGSIARPPAAAMAEPIESKPIELKPVDPKPALPRVQAAPDITGAISRAFASPAIEPKPGVFGVSLGRDASPDAVKRRWGTLSARYPAALARLAPRAQRNAASAGMFDLVAGPFASRADADRACAALAEQGLACDTTSYGGEPIGRP